MNFCHATFLTGFVILVHIVVGCYLFIVIDNKPLLIGDHIRIANKNAVEKKIQKMLQDGPKKLQVVSDFGRTITKQHANGKKLTGTFEILESIPGRITEKYRKGSAELYEKYWWSEFNTSLPLDQKKQAMNEWMIGLEEILRGLEIGKKDIELEASKYGYTLREKSKQLFYKLSKFNIPVLILSAGYGDVVEALLNSQGFIFQNVKIISNFFQFINNTIAGFKNHPIIHVFNKHEHEIVEEYYRGFKARSNVILMGDSLGDVVMADLAPYAKTVLKIGFLYNNVEESLPSYEKAFDIVIINDQTMNVILEILKFIL